jgi:hypothetical protein
MEPGCGLAIVGVERAAPGRVVTGIGRDMRRDRKRGPLYTPGFNMRDIEFFDEPQPAKKKPREVEGLSRQSKPKKKARRGHRGRGATRRWLEKHALKNARWLVKQLAAQIAFDLLEIRAMNFEENEKKWREQQQREAKAYAEKFTAAFREAVKREAASQTAA